MTTTPEAGMRLVPEKLIFHAAGLLDCEGYDQTSADLLACLAAAPVPPAGGEGEVEQLLADLKKGRDKRETTDPVWSEFNRHIQTVEALAARAPPPVGEVVIGEEGEVYTAAHLNRLLDGRDAFIVQRGLWPDFCDQCDTAHPAEPAARDGGEARLAGYFATRNRLLEQAEREGWTLARYAEALAAGEVVCSGCEGNPVAPNIPCAVCGAAPRGMEG